LGEWLQQAMNWYASMSAWQVFWLSVGFSGQIVFGSRFVVQWIISEKQGRSVVPTVFWYLSIVGSLLLFTYATYRIDPVFMVGQAGGLMIYTRNLVLIKREETDVDT
jgi:lipid-A-disaccharide synthase-like uncharacterized protein